MGNFDKLDIQSLPVWIGNTPKIRLSPYQPSFPCFCLLSMSHTCIWSLAMQLLNTIFLYIIECDVQLFQRQMYTNYSYVTSFINRAVIPRFSSDSCFLASADHRRIFSALNQVVKVRQRTSAGRRQVTVRWSPDLFRRWHNFRPMSRRQSAGAPAVTAGPPAGRRRMTINPTIIGRSPFGHRAVTNGFAMDEIWKWTFKFRIL